MGYETDRRKGRILLAVYFVVYLVLTGLMLLLIRMDQDPQLIGVTIVSALWTAVLFGAMWMGHNWARYAFLVLLTLNIMFTIPDVIEVLYDRLSLPPIFWIYTAFKILMFFTLIYSRPIRVLTRRGY